MNAQRCLGVISDVREVLKNGIVFWRIKLTNYSSSSMEAVFCPHFCFLDYFMVVSIKNFRELSSLRSLLVLISVQAGYDWEVGEVSTKQLTFWFDIVT